MARTHETLNQKLPPHPATISNQKKNKFNAAAGKLIPIQNIADSKVLIAPHQKNFGFFKKETVEGTYKMPGSQKYLLTVEKEAHENDVTINSIAKDKSRYMGSNTSQLQRNKEREKYGTESRLNCFSMRAIEGKDVLKEEFTTEERLWQKRLFVAKWILDCERAIKHGRRQQELTDLRYPRWMKTAMEMREKRFKQTSKNGHELVRKAPQRSRELQR